MLALRIAFRYLFAPKSHRAINAITIVATCGVAIITAALICMLSVYNGFEGLIGKLTSQLDPQLRIEATDGKFFADDKETRNTILSHPDVTALSVTLEETILMSNGSRQIPARMKGVDDKYRHVTGIDSITYGGDFMLNDPVADYTILGAGLSMQISCRPGFLRPLTFYCPRREGKIDLMSPEDSFVEHRFFCSALFAVRQSDYDDNLCLISLNAARQLLADSTLCSAYEVKLADGADPQKVKRELSLSGFDVLTQNEQQADNYRIVQIEKWITFALVIFILLIASFNIIGALSMLIIDKEPEIRTLRHLGADRSLIRRIFMFEGWLIVGLGAATGLILGITLCLVQQHFGIIGLGDGSGTFVIDSYPVVLRPADTLYTLCAVLGIGWLATAIANRT
ncbi:MAG: ABC transporter permease [Bacteroidales bacterium]|nr:ABC transporter permease [Candidatus Liminaster caballi]